MSDREEAKAMQVHISRHYSENRGDHPADAITAHTYDPAETVADMLVRVLGYPLPSWRSADPTEFVVLRVVSGTEPRDPDSGPGF